MKNFVRENEMDETIIIEMKLPAPPKGFIFDGVRQISRRELYFDFNSYSWVEWECGTISQQKLPACKPGPNILTMMEIQAAEAFLNSQAEVYNNSVAAYRKRIKEIQSACPHTDVEFVPPLHSREGFHRCKFCEKSMDIGVIDHSPIFRKNET